jgi:FkbM family methyltransferase
MNKWFEPYIKPLDLRPDRIFLYGTQQARDWFDPLPEFMRVEFEWLYKNVDFGEGRIFIDGGSHHGFYTIHMANGCYCICVDPHAPHMALLRANAALNNLDVNYMIAGLAHITGVGFYNGEPLGTMGNEGEKINTITLQDLTPYAHIVKLDIEGMEFYVLPASIDAMPFVDTWIVEIHPWDENSNLGNPGTIITMFMERDYEVYWIDRADPNPKVIEVLSGDIMNWKMQSTVIARKKRYEYS